VTPDEPVNAAPTDPAVRSFESTVRSVDGREVTLDRTYFYAEGGGQPPDRGSLAGVEVVDVQKRDGVTVHALAGPPDVAVGETVAGRIDDEFRTYAMRAHTASHVVYGAGRHLFDEHGYGGFDIGEDTVRIDLDVPSAADDVNALTVQRLANEAVWESRSVEWYEMNAEEARADGEIVFNVDETAVSDTVRIVEVDGWDIAACGGTHVSNTVEIGPIRVTEVSNPGAGLVRVEYAVGPAAIQRQVEERRSARRAAETVDSSVEALPQRARQVSEEADSLRAERDALRERLLDARLERLAADTVTVDGVEWLVGTADAADANAVAERVKALDDDAADVVALTGRDGSTFLVVGAGGDTDAAAVVDDATDEFGGGGGGRPTIAQGGGIDADPATVAEYLRPD
jgi:alanyl-tRNA synthetase